MKRPRCSYEWDVRQSPCPRYNLHVRPLGPQASANSQGPILSLLSTIKRFSVTYNYLAPRVTNVCIGPHRSEELRPAFEETLLLNLERRETIWSVLGMKQRFNI